MPLDSIIDVLTDHAAETGVIAALAVDPTLIDRLAGELVPEAFTDADIADCYRRVCDGRPVHAPAGARPVADVFATARRLGDLHGARLLAGIPTLLSQRLYALSRGEASLSEVTAEFASAAMRGVATATPAHPLRPSRDIVPDVLADVERRSRQRALTGDGIIGLRTGLPTLDEWIGGFEAGTLSILMARPSLGKTTVANQWAYQIASEGTPVLYITFENPPPNLVLKHLVRLANVPALDVLRGRVTPDRLAKAAETYRRDVGDRLYYETGTATTDVALIRGLTYRMFRRHRDAGCALVIVDYLQKLAMGPTNDIRRGTGFDDLRGSIARVLQELRDLAGQLNVPVIAISSVNRAAYNKSDAKPGLASGKESGEIEFSADTVLILSDETVNASPPPAPGFTSICLQVGKNRYGPTGDIALMHNRVVGRFEERTIGVATTNGRR